MHNCTLGSDLERFIVLRASYLRIRGVLDLHDLLIHGDVHRRTCSTPGVSFRGACLYDEAIAFCVTLQHVLSRNDRARWLVGPGVQQRAARPDCVLRSRFRRRKCGAGDAKRNNY